MTSEERDGLRTIRRRRLWAWTLAITYAPAIWIIRRLTNSELATAPFAIVWVIGIVRCVSSLSFSLCPRCGNLFYSAGGTPAFFNPFANRCLQCGLKLKTDHVIYPSMES
jgi:hypothetical protein